MNDRYRRIYDAILRVLNFMAANIGDFSSIPAAATYVAALTAARDTLSQLGVDKVTRTAAAKDAGISRGDRRAVLKNAMRDISDLWDSMADELNGQINLFRMPPSGSDQNLIAAARAFLAEAAPLRGEFTKRGLSGDFLQDLETDINEFVEIVNESEEARRVRVGTNAGFAEPARTAAKFIEKLDPIVRIIYRQNPSKRAEWDVASHIELPPRKKTVIS